MEKAKDEFTCQIFEPEVAASRRRFLFEIVSEITRYIKRLYRMRDFIGARACFPGKKI